MDTAAPTPRSGLDRLGRVLLVVAVLAWPAAWLLDAAFGREVTLLSRVRTEDERAAWRRGHPSGSGSVASIYGVVAPPEGVRVLVLDEDRLIVPKEDGDLRLLSLAEEGAVVRSRTFRFAAAVIALALGLVGAGLLGTARRRATAA